MFRLLLIAVLMLPGAAFGQTIEQMAGQMIVVGFQGTSAADPSVKALREEISAGEIGGVMFLKTNVVSLKAVEEMNVAFRAASPDLPPFITLDQEGGAVERLTGDVGFEEVPSARDVAAKYSPEQARSLYGKMAEAIARLGFTVNFGPVVDLDINPDNQVISKFGRSFGAQTNTVVAYAMAFINAHTAAGVITSLKHFPGHGSSTADSHEGFVDITRTWSQAELAPYKALFDAGYAQMVMVGHLFHADFSPGEAQLPSSLSPDWIEGILRRELGFKGVVVSDDLEMGAIRDHFNLHDTVVRAVNAGVDVLLFSNTAKYRPGLADEIRTILIDEAASDPNFAMRIKESYQRIVALKRQVL